MKIEFDVYNSPSQMRTYSFEVSEEASGELSMLLEGYFLQERRKEIWRVVSFYMRGDDFSSILERNVPMDEAIIRKALLCHMKATEKGGWKKLSWENMHHDKIEEYAERVRLAIEAMFPEE